MGVGAPLVAEQGQGGVRLDEALVLGDGLGETLLHAVLEPQQPAERGVVAVGGSPARGEGEAVGVDRAATGLAVQRRGSTMRATS